MDINIREMTLNSFESAWIKIAEEYALEQYWIRDFRDVMHYLITFFEQCCTPEEAVDKLLEKLDEFKEPYEEPSWEEVLIFKVGDKVRCWRPVVDRDIGTVIECRENDYIVELENGQKKLATGFDLSFLEEGTL